MARTHYWQYLVNSEGQPIQNASISVYIAETTTPAYLYTSEVGGGYLENSVPQLLTNTKGFFEFWIGDSSETYGYPDTTKFKIAWSGEGVIPGEIDNIALLHREVYEVDETSNDTTKNKLISNSLAKFWNDNALSNRTVPVYNYDYPIVAFNTATVPLSSTPLSGALYENETEELYYVDMEHNLESEYPTSSFFKSDTKDEFLPTYTEVIDTNTLRIVMNEKFDFHVKLVGDIYVTT